MLKQLLLYVMALLGAASFAIVFRTPRRYFLHTVFIGFAASVGMTLSPPSWNIGFATFIVALSVACLSHVFARVSRAPAQCFLIPGVIFLVPGTFIYRSLATMMGGDHEAAGNLALQALAITLGISFGILLANLLVPPRRTL